MAEFLVKSGALEAVSCSVKTERGSASATFRVRRTGTRARVTVPDALADSVFPEHVKHLVRLDAPAELPAEQPTMPATPNALHRRDEHPAEIDVEATDDGVDEE